MIYYLYNGKELQTDLDLNWYDYGARMYDASIAKWNAVDPKAENYISIGTYTYVASNPVVFVDPNGEEIWDANGNLVKYNSERGYFIEDGEIDQGTVTLLNTLGETEGGQEHIMKLMASDDVFQFSLHNETGISVEIDDKGKMTLVSASRAYTRVRRGRNKKGKRARVNSIHIFKGTFDRKQPGAENRTFSIFVLNKEGKFYEYGFEGDERYRGMWIEVENKTIRTLYQDLSQLNSSTGNSFRNRPDSPIARKQRQIDRAKDKSLKAFISIIAFHESELHGVRGQDNSGHRNFVQDEYNFLKQNFPDLVTKIVSVTVYPNFILIDVED